MQDRPLTSAAGRELPALFDALVEAAPNGILRVSAGGTITFANRHAAALFGYEPGELVGLGVDALVPERSQRVHAALRASFVHQPSVRPMGHGRDLFARRRDGSELPVEVSLGPSRDERGEVTTTVIVVDVTERKRAEAELRRRAERERAVADLGEQALKGVEIEALMNRAASVAADGLGVPFAKVLELRPGEGDLVLRAGVGWRAGVVGNVGLPLARQSQAAYTLSKDRPVVVEDLRSERRFRAEPVLWDHSVVSGATVVIRAGSAQFGVLGVHSDRRHDFAPEDIGFLQTVANLLAEAIHRRNYEQRIQHQALHDPLTGLPNRALFMDRLRQRCAGASRRAPFAVAFIDLDAFKAVNDRFGHGAGDELLRGVSPRLESVVRGSDTVARMGANEFVVIVDEVPEERNALALADRLAGCFARPIRAGERLLDVTASIGLAIGSGDAADPDALLRHADTAMYRAKSSGGDRVELFDDDMRARLHERVRLDRDIAQAFAERRLHLCYQPVVRLSDGSRVGMEALLRWTDPVRGQVAPSEFIACAESTGLIIPLGRWVLDEATAAAAHTGRDVAVNVSSRQVLEGDLLADVTAALQRSGLDPRALTLEVTESLLLEDRADVHATLRSLRELGVGLALDDFGTGFSSLSYLGRFPMSMLKIDRSFVAGLDEGGATAHIVAAIVTMAAALGMDVVAEGIETAGQERALRAIGCRFGQGHLFGRPAPLDLPAVGPV